MTMRYRCGNTGAVVNISRPAQKLIGPENEAGFVKVLTELMEAVGAKGAYISKRGSSLELSLYAPDGWTFQGRIPK